MTKGLKYLIVFVCVYATVVSGTPGPGEPPGLTGEKEAEGETKNEDASAATASEDASVTASEDSANNVTAAAEPDPVNVTESIESIVLPEVGSAAKEHSSSLAIFFLLFILILSIFLIHLLLKVKFHYLPESLAMGEF